MTNNHFSADEKKTIETALRHAYDQVAGRKDFKFQISSVEFKEGDDPKHPMILLKAKAPMQEKEDNPTTELESSIAYIPMEAKSGKLIISGFLDAYITSLQESLADIFTKHGFEVYVDQAFSYEW